MTRCSIGVDKQSIDLIWVMIPTVHILTVIGIANLSCSANQGHVTVIRFDEELWRHVPAAVAAHFDL